MLVPLRSPLSMNPMNTRTGVFIYGCPSLLVFLPSSMKGTKCGLASGCPSNGTMTSKYEALCILLYDGGQYLLSTSV